VGEIFQVRRELPKPETTFLCSRLCSQPGEVGEQFEYRLMPEEMWKYTLGDTVTGIFFSTPHNQYWGVVRYDYAFGPDAETVADPQMRILVPHVGDWTDLPSTEISCSVSFRVLASTTLPRHDIIPAIELSEVYHLYPDALVQADWPYGDGVYRVIESASTCSKFEPTLGKTWINRIPERSVAVGNGTALLDYHVYVPTGAN
jgi:hypothetical protein